MKQYIIIEDEYYSNSSSEVRRKLENAFQLPYEELVKRQLEVAYNYKQRTFTYTLKEPLDMSTPTDKSIITTDFGVAASPTAIAAAPIPSTTETKLDSKVKEALQASLLARKARLNELEVPKNMAEAIESVVEPPDVVSLEKGQQLFTTLVGTTVEVLKGFGLRDFGVSVTDGSVMPAFVPTVKPGYNVQVAEAHALLMAWEMGEKCLITGPTGSGKSSLIEHCAALTKRPFLRVNMTGDIESSVLFGQLVVESGATVWKDGPVTEAVKQGCVLSIDEWDVTPPEILFGMQWLFEENGKLFLKEKPGDADDKFIVPHDGFRLVCSGNTVGQGDDTGRYSGTNVQNNASIDRFQTTIVLDYLPAEHEEKILVDNCTKMKKPLAKKMVSFAALIRTACATNQINLTMSPRTLINWGRKSLVYGDVKHALSLAFLNKMRDTDKKVALQLFDKVFGSNTTL